MSVPPAALAEALRDRYELERELGSGGMATVYLARDLRHERPVALKLLRPELAASLGSDRFFREIKLAAGLQHPHILPVHDSGEAGGFVYYVMPYVDGESLRGRLTRQGELPVHDAVKILVEVADALAHAHAHGVVHRDIKPDNVMLSGRHALVTDFGVAKAVSEATGRQQLTTAGVALGTPAYMAPEQAVGEPHLDQRVDIYALGVLGYELLAGRPPFTGRTSQEVLAAQVTQAPEPLSARRPACPPALEAVVMRCLEKHPADRWQTAEEVLAQLEPLATPSGGMTPTTTRPAAAIASQPRRKPWARWMVAAAALLAVGAALAVVLTRKPPVLSLGRRVQLTLDPGLEIDPALSPDGKFVAFVAGPLGQTRLYVRQVEGGAPVAVTPGRGGYTRVPRWSPDGTRLLFRSERGLEVMPALGGQSKLILPVEPSAWAEGSWSPDGRSIAYPLGDTVYVRSLDGRQARVVAGLAEAHSCAWSSDGRRLACVSGNRQFVTNEDFGNIANCAVWVLPAAGGTPVRVTDDQSLTLSPLWVPGRASLLYLSNREGGRDLYQMSLSRAGGPAGGPTRLTTGLNAGAVSLSADGRRLAYAVFTATSNIWSLPIPETGTAGASRAEPVTAGNQVIERFDLSADGRWLAFDSDRGGTQQIYRTPLGGGEVEQLTTDVQPAFYPSFSKDGREIAYHRFQDGHRQIFVLPAEGGTPTQVTAGREHYRGPEWSPDGRTLAMQKAPKTPAQETDVVARDANGKWGVPRTLVKGGTHGVWTPDGSAVLTLTSELGPTPALEIVPVDGGARKVVVSVRDRTKEVVPAYIYYFSADGRVIYFLGRAPSDRTIGIWRVPAAGGTPQPVVRFDDPSRPWHPFGFRVHGGKFYFTVGERHSDIWMTEVAISY